jgi:hypothetical protein
MTRVDELVDGIYMICPTVQLPGTDFQFNQFPIDDERPTLIHTGVYGLYEGVGDGIARSARSQQALVRDSPSLRGGRERGHGWAETEVIVDQRSK